MILSYEHGLIRKDYLEKMLKGLPKGKICMKNAHGKLVKSVYVSNCDDEYHCRKYYVVRKEPGKTFAAKISLSQKLSTQLEETLAALKTEAEPKPSGTGSKLQRGTAIHFLSMLLNIQELSTGRSLSRSSHLSWTSADLSLSTSRSFLQGAGSSVLILQSM